MMAMRKILVAISLLFLMVMPAKAADRAKIAQFMAVTGFDVALESMRLSARDAPTMLGLDADDFGLSWSRLADRIFEPEALKNDALEILDNALTDDVLAHATQFYGSKIGQRLVTAENESHGLDFEDREAEGARLAQALSARGSPQPQYFLDMAESIGYVEATIKAYREVQVRFLMAASLAGLIDQRFDEVDLRAMLAQQDDEVRRAMAENLIVANAFTYRDFTDSEIEIYRDALAMPQMMEVYELMNAIHFTIMADRFERMALEMVNLTPTQEL
ncbi:DUF2059 domain-containing protein [Planktomarina sp.]|uniref:DUF2059 domain-containing protein n=2 Tax=Planktomarina sp. TaxID=2024851 RepID=UPI003C769F86